MKRPADLSQYPGQPRDWQPCRRDTKRCEFWTWALDYERPECCTKHLEDLLLFTAEMLRSHGIPHWLDFGALLGAIRNGRLIAWDSDGDFGVWRHDLRRILALEDEIARAGYILDASDPFVVRIQLSRSNTQHVDLFPWFDDGGFVKMHWPGSTPERWAFPAHFLADLQPVSLNAHSFPAPSPTVEFLSTYRYGPHFMRSQRPVLSDVPDILPQDLTPLVGSLLDEIRLRDYRISQLDQRIASGPEAATTALIRNKVRSHLAQRLQSEEFEHDLVLLHDALEGTPITSRYWMLGGLLLGWARQGSILPHDSRDADFGFRREDHDSFLEAIPSLIKAGFEPVHRYVDNAGRIVEYRFRKGGAMFDFFVHDAGNQGLITEFFGTIQGQPVQFTSRVPAFRLVPFDFLGRTWWKPDEHEVYLSSVYGEWKTPDPKYDYKTQDRSIVDRRRWTGSNHWPSSSRPSGLEDVTPVGSERERL